MLKKPLAFVCSILALSVLLTSCVGGRTEPDPDRHPDPYERKLARKGIYG